MTEWPKADWLGIRDRFTCINRLYNQKSSLCRPWFRGSWMSLPTHEHARHSKDRGRWEMHGISCRESLSGRDNVVWRNGGKTEKIHNICLLCGLDKLFLSCLLPSLLHLFAWAGLLDIKPNRISRWSILPLLSPLPSLVHNHLKSDIPLQSRPWLADTDKIRLQSPYDELPSSASTNSASISSALSTHESSTVFWIHC